MDQDTTSVGATDAQVTLALLPLYAWVALAVMTHHWSRNQKAHAWWPVTGTLAGLTCTLLSMPAWSLYVVAVPFAFYLAWFHLWGWSHPGA